MILLELYLQVITRCQFYSLALYLRYWGRLYYVSLILSHSAAVLLLLCEWSLFSYPIDFGFGRVTPASAKKIFTGQKWECACPNWGLNGKFQPISLDPLAREGRTSGCYFFFGRHPEMEKTPHTKACDPVWLKKAKASPAEISQIADHPPTCEWMKKWLFL